ncbi:MAG TPA: PQQ-dependent dehydrogenase, methanol/ethanol family [Vicinamibacterales bacterium]|jgi:alcohol dehydrogenase (cytochrome c)|nr:PQQ-dependent dehydrogenase, methanol/ethanol family [Vicinamibacterales bacterium]
MKCTAPLILLLCFLCSTEAAYAQAGGAAPGRTQFENRCGVCHGGDGNGGEYGPGMVAQLAARSDAQLAALIREGLPGRGMPATPNLSDAEIGQLTQFLRTLKPRARAASTAAPKVTLELTNGRSLEGTPLNHGVADDVQLRTGDGRIELLRKAGNRYRPVTSEVDWPTHDGSLSGNRYTTLTGINKGTVARLAPRWIYTLQNTSRLEVTPVVVEGVMYVTGLNECYALDAGNGREIWRFQRPRTRGLVGNAAGGINRGAAVAKDRVFLVTDHAHLLALNRFTGELLWDTEMADWRQNYNATSAPLVVGDLVISGTAGGEQGVRGFVAAYDQTTGKELWRFWTVPKPGEPGSETWIGSGIQHPGGVTWMTGVYDPELRLVYWTTGNPSPDYNGDDRLGDNLYSSSVVALDVQTGQLKWHYQFTPHNVWDWDAEQPTVLVDTVWAGERRKLLVQASRNGFFYVLDRTDGKLLLAKPFVKQLTWAREIGPDGRPVLNPNQVPTPDGTSICPSSHGAANWYSTSFSPITGFYYVQTNENCNIFVKNPSVWAAGQSYMGGSTRQAPEAPNQKVLRAIDVKTGKVAWELPETGPGASRGGTLATAGGLVFFCDDQDRFAAVDASTGKPLWQFPTGNNWRASPMTYQFDEKQYIAIASGSNIIVFGLVD